MNQMTRTLTFVGVALALAIVAFATRPTPITPPVAEVLGEPFFPDLTDPLAVRALEIVEFDEATSTLKPFKVAQVNGLWSIPSEENYPADAEKQVANAAASLIDLKKDNLASSDRRLHEEYGVIDPDPSTLQVGAEGVGRRVTLYGDDDKKLAEFIIGKEVPGQSGLRYVRDPKYDATYVARLDTRHLTTKFSDWIEDDLLKINLFDITQVDINDYSIDEAQRALVPRSKIQLAYDNDSTDSKWKLKELEVFDFNAGDWQSTELAANEQLNEEKLNEMRTALDDLKIVDVNRKPQGLQANLQLDAQSVSNPQIRNSLTARGFFPQRVSEGVYELLSNEGEVFVGLKNGVEYVLRFGEIALGSNQSDDDADAAADGEAGDSATEDKPKGENRFIMIAARFREDLIPKPELTPLPGEEAAEEGAEEGEAPAATEPAAESDGEQTSATGADDELLLAQADGDAETSDGDAAGEAEDESPATEAESAKDDEDSAQPAAEADAEKSETTEGEGAEAEDSQTKTENDAAAERARIEVENKRKQQEYDNKVKAGKERVEELNRRFGDWYYIISDDVYRKIHLSREDIIKQKEIEPGEGDGVGDFEALKEGLDSN